MQTFDHEYKTSVEYGPFGECDTVLVYDYQPGDEYREAEVTLTGGKFYSNGAWIEFDAEVAMNARLGIEDDILEYHADQLAREDDIDKYSGGYEG